MPKNKGKGGKSRRRGKNDSAPSKRELVLKEEGQAYAQIQTMLGNNRLQAMCDDRVQRMCHIRGKMRKKVWMGVGDIILVGLRDFQDDKADVILKYLPEEARMLKSKGQLPDFFNECNDDEGGAVEFVDDFDDSTSEEDVFFDGSDEEEVEEGAEGAVADAVEEGDEDIARPTQRKGEKVIPGIGKKTAEKLAEEKKEREMEKLMPKSKLKKERGPSKREIKRSEDRDKKRNYSLDDL